jgi:hypothetical protein
LMIASQSHGAIIGNNQDRRKDTRHFARCRRF